MKLKTKKLAYQAGMLGGYHRLRNRKLLTVAMFHRILPPADPRHAGADPEWTMTPTAFAGCLGFFRKHYHVVSPAQVFAALGGGAPLPARALLVTFDDGWADTAEYAQPLLAEFAMPALVFVAGCAIDQAAAFWQEHVYSYLATEPGAIDGLTAAWQRSGAPMPAAALPAPASEAAIRELIDMLGKLDSTARDAIVAALRPARAARPAMLDAAQLARLIAAGHTIGGHGMTHQPLTRLERADLDLRDAQAALAAYSPQPRVESMSFPHGAWSDTVVAHAHAAGYRYLFSSEACLNGFDDGNDAPSRPVGRIHIAQRAIVDAAGTFQPALLAAWLFLRPARPLAPIAGVTHGR
jgi:peptidoglycan/xylan/chitin deacetylase (PgdA/CDA1 family)